MKKQGKAFSIAKTRRRVLFVTAMALGLTAGGLGLKTLVESKGDASATSNREFSARKLVEINPLYEQYLEDVENGEGDKWTLVPNKYIPVTEDDEGTDGSLRSLRKKMVGDSNANSDINLPEQYNLREEGFATPLKDQGAEGLCWAFATTTAMESYLKKTQNLNVEFSPKQLDYLLGTLASGEGYLKNTFGVTHELGGAANFLQAGIAFGMTGEAPVYEEAFFARLKAKDTDLANFQSWSQYGDWNRLLLTLRLYKAPLYQKEMSKDDITADDSAYIVTSYTDYSASSGVINKVKEHVYNKGAVEIGTFLSFEPNCFDAATKTIVDRGDSICNPNHEAVGHAMSVVGWDDNYEYTDPATNETKTGALILQNSWGPSSLFHDFGFKSVDDVIERFGLTVDNFIATETQTKEEVFNKWKNDVQGLLGENGYDAPEVVYYAYDFASESSVDFGMIEEMRENHYDAIYSNVINSNSNVDGFKKKDFEITESDDVFVVEDETFTFSTSERMAIDAIGVNSLIYGLKYKLAIDTGNGFKDIDIISLDDDDKAAGQKTLNLASPIAVQGNFKVKLSLNACDKNNMCSDYPLYLDLNKNGVIEINENAGENELQEFDFINDVALVVFLYDDETISIDDPVKNPDDPDDHPPREPSDQPYDHDESYGETTWISGEKYTIGEGKDLVFKVDYSYEYFDSIKLDNKTLETKNYKVESGSTKITIFHDYLDTLSVGEHNIKVAFKGNRNEANLKFTVAAARTNTDGENQGGGTGAGGGADGEDKKNETVADAPSTSSSTESRSTGTSNTGRFTAEAQERAELTIIFTLPVAVVIFGIFRFSKLKK